MWEFFEAVLDFIVEFIFDRPDVTLDHFSEKVVSKIDLSPLDYQSPPDSSLNEITTSIASNQSKEVLSR